MLLLFAPLVAVASTRDVDSCTVYLYWSLSAAASRSPAGASGAVTVVRGCVELGGGMSDFVT